MSHAKQLSGALYSRLQTSEEEDNTKAALCSDPEQHPEQNKANVIIKRCTGTIVVVALVTAGLLFGLMLSPLLQRHFELKDKSCKEPSLRKEWRTLSVPERNEYIRAVTCLKETPSRLFSNQTLYDDFPWTHFRWGGSSHGAASFIAWHRMFLHIYEQALRTDCSYEGHLTYWDWTLDWTNFTHAPPFSQTPGFGTDGNVSTGTEIMDGYCVTDGAFANLSIPFVDDDMIPHCLSRGFLQGDALRKYSDWINPKAIHSLLLESDFNNFNLGLEDGPHIAIPRMIRGDFSMFTAPSDPLFFLHHTQLDRIWWLWQTRDPSLRQYQYNGRAGRNDPGQASLSDRLVFGGLAEGVRARDIMDTEGSLLCYVY